MNEQLPVAVIGAGPVGLAAAAQLVSRGLQPLVLEKGATVGAAMLNWGHVKVFSPWRYTIDAATVPMLEATGWRVPDAEAFPTGAEIVERYLEPLSRVPGIAVGLKLGTEVIAVTRRGLDKLANGGRADAPFALRVRDANGERTLLARAVIDASGTWSRPNPAGIDGLSAPGERENADRIEYGIPDVAGAAFDAYAGKTVLVLGGGHSAINAALAMIDVKDRVPDTTILWGLRRNSIGKLLGGGLNDQLPARGALGLKAQTAIRDGRVEMLAPFSVQTIARAGERLMLDAEIGGAARRIAIDRMIVATGFRPDLSFLSEIRIALDPAVEAPPKLAPLIDPNLHSCGDVPPHGIDELAQPEAGFYIVGAKSYGRAPTFLMLTGYEQVRSIVAEIAGDTVAARDVRLVLPKTGVCSVPEEFAAKGAGCCGAPAATSEGAVAAGCCGGAAPAASDACCVADATAKAEGASGCGCGSAKATERTRPVADALA